MEVRSLLRLRHGLAWHCSTVRIGPLPHWTCHLFNKCFHISPDCLTAVAFYSCLAGRVLSVSLRWRHSSDIARQMAGWGRDRAGGDFCFSACLTLANNPSPGLGTQISWTWSRVADIPTPRPHTYIRPGFVEELLSISLKNIFPINTSLWLTRIRTDIACLNLATWATKKISFDIIFKPLTR